MPRIIPIRNLKNTNEISRICHNADEPIFVTKNGYGDLVVMSMERYETAMRRLEVLDKIAEAEEDVRQGRVLPAEDSLRKLREKYGL